VWRGDHPAARIGVMRKTALIVDDHPSFRASARRLLEADGYQVVGEAEDGLSALAAADRLRPDLVLLDVRLPGIDGFEVARLLLTTEGSEPQVVLTSSHDSSDLADAIDASGASGFIPKGELTGTALAALLG
jgi:DNA-binding NarL/FixJ family response regulator